MDAFSYFYIEFDSALFLKLCLVNKLDQFN